MPKSLFRILPITAAVSIALSGCLSSSDSEPSTPPQSKVTLSGVVADGYLENATVCLDLNLNKQCDANEPFSLTDSAGAYSFTAGETDKSVYPVISVITAATKDADTPTRTLQPYVMSAPAGKPEFISPMTTMIQTEIESNPGMSIDSAESSVKTNLGYSASDEVSLFKDYVAAQENTATGSDEDKAKYKRIHRIAQLTARALEANHTVIADAAAEAGLDKDALLNELVRIVVKQVIDDMNKITTIVDGVDPTANFNPDLAENTPDIAVNTNELEDSIAAEEAVSAAATINIAEILNAGIHGLKSTFNTRVSDSEFQTGTIKGTSTGTIEFSNNTWNGTDWALDTPTSSGVVSTDFAQVLTANGLLRFDRETEVESFIDNNDSTANLLRKDADGNIISQSKLQGAEVSLAGKRIRPTFTELEIDGDHVAWEKATPGNAIFPANAKGYRWNFTTTNDTYYVGYVDASTGCTEIGDTSLLESKNCRALSDAPGSPVAASALSELTSGTAYYISSLGATAAFTATDASTGTVSYSIPDGTGGTKTLAGTYTIETPFGGSISTIEFNLPREIRGGKVDLDDASRLFILIDEGYARLGRVELGNITDKDESVYYDDVALQGVKDCFMGGTNNAGTGTCPVELFLKNGAIVDGAVVTRENKTMIPFNLDVAGTTMNLTATKHDGTDIDWKFAFNVDGSAAWTSTGQTVAKADALTWVITGNGRLKIQRPLTGDLWMVTLLDDGTMHVRRKLVDSTGAWVKNYGGYMTDLNAI